MRRHLPFLVVLFLTSVARFAILFQSQTHVHSDEAIIGLMGKHILEGRNFPFYMYGQSYNAGAAWEAYLAAAPFAIFGVGVIPLKSAMVVLSLVCLIVFYGMAQTLYNRRTAALAALLFALSPSLLKWHFQVRGYSWYFLSIPVLTWLFYSLACSATPRARQLFFFGLVSGLSVWNLELVVSLVAAMWVLLAVRRTLSGSRALFGAAGLVVGYAPAILFNFANHFRNWQSVFAEKTSSPGSFGASDVVSVFAEELPKFFGPDTILWYYAEKPLIGYVFYAIALLTVTAAAAPFVRQPSRIRGAFRGDLAGNDENKDFVMLLLTSACFVPYVIAPTRVPGYFLSGCFFLSVLTGRLVVRCRAAIATPIRILGLTVLAAALLAGTAAMIHVARQNEIETLTLDNGGNLYLKRFPGADIDAVGLHLRGNGITSVWTTVSFVYPLSFESNETLATSGSIFGWDQRVYPESVPQREPDPKQRQVFVLETDSPLRPGAEAQCARATGAPPRVSSYGTLTVIEEDPRR